MTAEVAVMNRQAIALAADSAITVTTARGSRKAWPSATKIFALPEPHSIALMMYGSTSLHRLPWETVIKEFGRSLPKTAYGHVADYRTAFLRFLRSRKAFYPADEQELYVYAKLVIEYLDLRREIDNEISEALAASPSGELTPAEQRALIRVVIDRWHGLLNDSPRLKRLPRDYRKRFAAAYRNEFREAKSHVFQKLPLTQAQSRRLTTIGHLMFERQWTFESHSGIVVAGYGTDDLFPGLHQLEIEGFVLNYLIYSEISPAAITRDNSAWIRPFAQGDDVSAFMEGVQPRYNQEISRLLHHRIVVLPQELVETLLPSSIPKKQKEKVKKELLEATGQLLDETLKELQTLKYNHFVSPVIDVVSSLPIEDLAVMAETLVNLASFRQKVSMSVETVGGPVDVAVISKGDGFVWIKRKNYFALDQNPRVLARHFTR